MQIQKITFEAGDLILSRYKVLYQLGAGGMGQVYAVEDMNLSNEKLALKIITPSEAEKSDPHAVERFRSEVLISRKLTHQNIIRTYDYGTLEDGRLYMTMEFVDGTTLDSYIKKNKDKQNNFAFNLLILKKIAEALMYAQKMGVTHRDLKTSNILISKGGDLKIADFGLAQMKGFERRLTVTGECVGTPYYMSPEQVQGKQVNHISDLYSLGIIAYEIMIGNVPFSDDNWFGLANKIFNDPLPRFITPENKIPQWFDDFVRKATAKDIKNRYQSAAEILQVFEENYFSKKEEKQYDVPKLTLSQFSPGIKKTLETPRIKRSWLLTAMLTICILGLLSFGGYYAFNKVDFNKFGISRDERYNGPIRLAPAGSNGQGQIDIGRNKPVKKDNPENKDQLTIDSLRKILEKNATRSR